MEDERDLIQETPPATDVRTPQQIIDDLRANSVPRAEHEQLQQDYSNLLEAYADGARASNTESAPEEQAPTADELRARLNNGDLFNLEYVETALQLRQTVMEEGGEDPFVPQGTHQAPTREDYVTAARVAECLQSCVDESNGDSGVFTALLQSYITDVPLSPRGANKKARR